MTVATASKQRPPHEPAPFSPSIVIVEWHDAWADSEQHERSEWRSDYIVRTTGFLVRDEPDVVSIAQEILPEEDGFRSVTHIPRGMIEKVTLLGTSRMM